MTILFELLRLAGGSPVFAQNLHRFLGRTGPLEIPIENLGRFRFCAYRSENFRPGYAFRAALHPMPAERPDYVAPEVHFWLDDQPGCGRALIPFRWRDSSLGRDELFAEYPPGALTIGVEDPNQLEAISYYCAQWDIELRARGTIERFLAGAAAAQP